MEKLEQKLTSCRQALVKLAEAVDLPFSVIVRDACIQRFEYSFESAWKLLKAYLAQHEGILCNSPKGCFREALSVGLLNKAEAIYRKIPAYLAVMQALLANIQQQIELLSPGGE